MLFALAGRPRELAEACSYAERLFVYQRIEQLPHDEAIAAVRDPADGHR